MTDHDPDALAYASIVVLARRLRDGSLTSEALTMALLERSERLDPALGAFRLRVPERALAVARSADLQLRAGQDLGPLHGIPYGLKDIFDVAGLPTSAGWSRYDDRVMDADSAAHASLARAGMVMLGKTNTVQFASGFAGINHDHGTPHNPWHAEPHLPGGSSSGSAVGVAAGLFPMGLGSDTGGSVRGPAALCGVVGLKTTVGRLSRAGAFVLSPTLDSVGPLTRTVEDAALVFMAMQGPDVADPTTHGVAPIDVLSGLAAGVEGMRLVYHRGACVADADPEVVAIVDATREVFASLGARVEEADIAEVDAALDARALSQIEGYLANAGRFAKHLDAIDPIVSRRLLEFADTTDAELAAIIARMHAARASACAALAPYQAVITPTTRQPALPVAEVDASFESYRDWSTRYTNTNFGNLLGQCGVSVPCGFTAKGLPVGLQICARPFAEDVALRIAHAYEQATDWHLARPSLEAFA